MRVVKEFKYRDRDCIICERHNGFSSWLTAYTFLYELNDYYRNEVERVPDFFDRQQEPLDTYFWENSPYISYFNICAWEEFKDTSYYNSLCCGLDLNNLWNRQYETTLDVDLAEVQLKEMIDFIEDNYYELMESIECL